ncbi:hypothetical protein COV19_07425 [Candidatus Woesearchaeota archaeon CG10_big_fil_rev_8_21_14_0_10_44_13]|nr:MAG: hypothetical protein COV19_07425 [Candidatus Woesearchaeota archaeon CG10_big_fil_rev_8_21_14_0_10_44_13]
MTNITLSVPDDLHGRMKHFSEIRWSEVARKAIEQKVEGLELMDKLAAKSRLTQKDADEIGEKIKESAAKRLKIK